MKYLKSQQFINLYNLDTIQAYQLQRFNLFCCMCNTEDLNFAAANVQNNDNNIKVRS